MSPLNITLLGAVGHDRQQLAEALARSIGANKWPAKVLETDNTITRSAEDLILLMGLDKDVRHDDADTDASIRSALSTSGMAYAVLYGSPEERHAQALMMVHRRLTEAGKANPSLVTAKSITEKTKPWVWLCDKCSDPQCEHRLLSALLASRTTEPLPEAVADDPGG